MTAEIVVMNRSAVALAADSAVTVRYTRQGDGDDNGEFRQKIFNSVNKLFMLSKYQPVGIMIYGDADLMSVPWEVMIKEYRRHLNDRCFDSINEYAQGFIDFLDGSEIFFPQELQDRYVKSQIFEVFNDVRSDINEFVQDLLGKKRSLNEQAIAEVVQTIITGYHKHYSELPSLECCPDGFEDEIVDRYREMAEQLQEQIFQKLPIEADSAQQLLEVAVRFLTRDFEWEHTGVVITGYGDKEIFPALRCLNVRSVVLGKVLYRIKTEAKVDINSGGGIFPFAQREMVYTFMEGINPKYHQVIDGYLEKLFDDYPEQIVLALPRMTRHKKDALIAKLKEVGRDMLADFNDATEAYRKDKHTDPTLSNITSLPKDELATVAEAFVYLTSLKRRFSLDAETVGGPIDVAVISKGDGFIWIKRKHYFDKELNPRFIASSNRDVSLD